MTAHDAHDDPTSTPDRASRAPGADCQNPARASVALRSQDLMSPELVDAAAGVDAAELADSLDVLLDVIEDGEMTASALAVAYLYGARQALRALPDDHAVHETTV